MPAPDEITLLHQALQGMAAAGTPRTAARALLSACVRRTNASGGQIYLLRLSSAAYEPFAAFPGDGPEQHRKINARTLAVPRSRISSLEAFRRAVGGQEQTVDGVAIYASRGRSCIGVIELVGPSPESFDGHARSDLMASANLLVSVYEDEFAFNLFSKIQQPVDFQRSEAEFFGEIALLIAEASGMEFVAVRERTDDRALRCLANWGFPGQFKLSDFDLEVVADYPPFAKALAGETSVVRSISDPDARSVQEMPWSKPIQSFVAVPVKLGREVFGVLSVAASCPFEYALVEERGIESIANGVGVSILNFRNSHRLSQRIAKYTEAAVAITAVEAARAARHEAIGHIDTCQIKLSNLYGQLGRHGKAVEDEFDAISGQIDAVRVALDKIRLATKVPSPEWARVDLLELWNEARTAVAGRIGEERIDVRVSGPHVEVLAIPDRLRHVFLNLLLNSLDAFKDAKKGGRRIEFTIAPPSDRARQLEVIYRDTAGGINRHALRLPSEVSVEQPLQQVLFEPGVTSKKDGSGFGLWLVRNILDEHRGSIDLTDYRGGVTFVVRLPKPDDAGRLLGESL